MEYKKLKDIFFEIYSKVNYILLSERIIKLEEVSSIGKDKIIKEIK